MSFRRSTKRRSPLRPPTKLSSKRPPSRKNPPGQASTRPESPGSAERLHKALARAGLGSRRALELAIAKGRVLVDGRPATLGQRVSRSSRIVLDGREIRLESASGVPRLLLYHKPPGEIVSREDPRGRPSVFDRLPEIRGARWIAVGRLDFNTSGLLLFTDSGELANELMHPRFGMQREYAVRLLGALGERERKLLLQGVPLEDGPAKFDILEEAGGTGSNRWYRVVLHEGRNREVRRMFEAVGRTVSRLIRVAFGDLRLPRNLRQGQARELPPAEVKKLFH